MPWESNFDLDAIAERINAAMPAALVAGMEAVRSYVIPQTPIRSGHLRNSGEVRQVDEHTVELYFPGPYARYQEYGVFYRHGRFGPPLTYTPPGRARFLELGCVEGTDAAMSIIARMVGDAL